MTVYDCFTFWSELDILEIRLIELYPVVDWFVLVEATRTHKGDPKPLYYAENRHRFSLWNDKIIHIAVGDLPDGDAQAAIWRREISQRQAIERGLRDVPDDALILISDLDEIPRREVIGRLGVFDFPDDMVVTFDQMLYYYNVNTACVNPRWRGTRATLASNVQALTPDGVRWETLKSRSNEYPRHGLIDGQFIGLPPGSSAGWHLSYFGDVAHIQNKMRAFLHQELVNDETLDADTIAQRMSAGLDVWGRTDQQHFEVGPATDLPWAIRADPAKYARYFHPDWRPEFHENWYGAEQAAYVGYLAQQAPNNGAIVEIGCWEGRSIIAIAQSVSTDRLIVAVDHWRGNEDEGAEHPATEAAAKRDVYATFVRNLKRLDPQCVAVHRQDWREWIARWDQPIAFLHLDAAHDYQSVYDCLCAVKPFLVPGAIVCGDDLYADGVYRGTRDALGDDVQDVSGRLWVWQNREGL